MRSGSDSTRELARIAYLRGSLYFARGDLDACAAEHERALAHAREAGDEACEAQALSGLADVLYANGRMSSAHAAFSRCVALSDRRGDVRFTLMNRNMMGLCRPLSGRGLRALATVERSRLAAREIGHRVAEVMADECAGLVLVGAGRDQEAVAPVERSLALAREIASRRFAAIDLALLGLIAAARAISKPRGRGSTRLGVAGGDRAALAGPMMLAAQARIAAVRRGTPRAGSRRARRCCGRARSRTTILVPEEAIDGSLEAGDLDEAERHADELERYASVEPTPWSAFIVARGRALVAARRGTATPALFDRDAHGRPPNSVTPAGCRTLR